jgi:hypothetical protein
VPTSRLLARASCRPFLERADLPPDVLDRVLQLAGLETPATTPAPTPASASAQLPRGLAWSDGGVLGSGDGEGARRGGGRGGHTGNASDKGGGGDGLCPTWADGTILAAAADEEDGRGVSKAQWFVACKLVALAQRPPPPNCFDT